MNAKGFGRNRSSPNQALARFVRIYLFIFVYLTVFYCSSVIYFLWHSNFLFRFGLQLQLAVQSSSSSLHISTTHTALYHHCPSPTSPVQYLCNITCLYPRILFLDCFILKRAVQRSFETSELLPQRHGVTFRTIL
jgi:hypothetical protein